MKRLAILLGYIAAALWITWPLARQATSALPITTMKVGTVPLLNAWTVWWNADRLQHGYQHYWTAPIFHPTPDTFAFSEAQPVTALVAPVLWVTGSRELAYNWYLWMSLVLNAVFAERLLRQLGVARPLAVAGGFAMLLLPLVHLQLEVLQLIPVWGILWTWAACYQWSRQPTLRRGAEAGLAFGVAFLTCQHQGLLLSLLLACTVWICVPVKNLRAVWLSVVAAGLVAAILVVPVAWKLHRAVNRVEFQRKVDVVTQLSARPSSYLEQTGLSWFEPTPENGNANRGLNPGWLKVALAVCGVAFGLSRRRYRRATIFFLAMGLLAFGCSLGPHLQIGTWQPWWTLTRVWPGLAQVRSVFRFAFFVQMIVVLLAVVGVHGLWLLIRRYTANRESRLSYQILLLLVALAMAIETHPPKLALFNTPNPVANRNWIGFVRDHTPAGASVACFPFPPGDSVDDYEIESRWMFYGTYHGRPLANGYSGFFPDRYFALQDAINAKFPSDAALQKLRQAKVELLVINRNVMTFPVEDKLTVGAFTLARVFQDTIGVDVYRLEEVGKSP